MNEWEFYFSVGFYSYYSFVNENIFYYILYKWMIKLSKEFDNKTYSILNKKHWPWKLDFADFLGAIIIMPIHKIQ